MFTFEFRTNAARRISPGSGEKQPAVPDASLARRRTSALSHTEEEREAERGASRLTQPTAGENGAQTPREQRTEFHTGARNTAERKPENIRLV